MNKFKFDIQKNNLSWEKSSIKKCDTESCNESGQYRAPKSRINLNEYFFFCFRFISNRFNYKGQINNQKTKNSSKPP